MSDKSIFRIYQTFSAPPQYSMPFSPLDDHKDHQGRHYEEHHYQVEHQVREYENNQGTNT